MEAELRRKSIINTLAGSKEPISGAKLAEMMSVSRQIIVQDIAALKNSYDIVSTHRGYVLLSPAVCSRVFKVFHTDEQIEDELNTIVDLGGKVEDVFIRHRTYGEIHAQLNISSRYDVRCFLEQIASGKSYPLKNVTSNYHYHTISACSEEVLVRIEAALRRKGFLAEFFDYEG